MCLSNCTFKLAVNLLHPLFHLPSALRQVQFISRHCLNIDRPQLSTNPGSYRPQLSTNPGSWISSILYKPSVSVFPPVNFPSSWQPWSKLCKSKQGSLISIVSSASIPAPFLAGATLLISTLLTTPDIVPPDWVIPSYTMHILPYKLHSNPPSMTVLCFF